MLVVSPAASAAIVTVLSSPGVPKGSGLRLARGPMTGEGVAIQLEVAPRPEPQDEVLETATGAEVFVDARAKELLDDQVLDAELEIDGVTFEIRPQPLNGHHPR